MAVPLVAKKLLRDIEAMGSSVAQPNNALHCSGNASCQDAVNWRTEHENNSKIDEASVEIPVYNSDQFQTSDAVPRKADELRNESLKRKRQELEKVKSKKAKGVIQVGVEPFERQNSMKEKISNCDEDSHKREKYKAERARALNLEKLEEDMNRQLNLGLPSENAAAAKSSYRNIGGPVHGKSTRRVEYLRECLKSIKGNCQGDNGEVKTAFRTLSIYVRNIVKNPGEEKFRRIRASNPNFRTRVARITGGIEYLRLCGFEWTEDKEFLHLPQNKLDPALMSTAASVLDTALSNPFFGIFYKGQEEAAQKLS